MMTKSFPRQVLLTVVEASPKAVVAHDKEAWLSIFAEENIIEDPVGSSPHCTGLRHQAPGKKGRTALERFYDTFIAPNEIRFRVDQDIVVGNTVIRDLTIEINMSKGLLVSVPMHIFYELKDEGGKPRICHLSAHWELPAMIKRVMSHGLKGLYAMARLGIRMMKHQGLGGSLGFSKGFWGIHQKGKDYVKNFVMAANSKHSDRITGLFCSDNTGIEFPATGSVFFPETFTERVDILIAVSKEISAGLITTFTFDADYLGHQYRGVGRVAFDSKTKKIKNVRLFWD